LQYILGTGIYVEGISNPDVKCCGPETNAVALQCDLLFTSDFIETYFHLQPFEGRKLHFNPVRLKLIYGICMRPELIPHETHIFFHWEDQFVNDYCENHGLWENIEACTDT